jgi:hypothetical protein
MGSMKDPWMERLSEYVDGELAADEARQLEAHVEACDDCAAALRDLRTIIAAADTLEDRDPARDLWGGIAAAIETGSPAALPAGDVLDLRQFARHRAPARFTFSAPQLAAAAVLLVAISASGVYWLTGRQGVPAQQSGIIMQAAVESPEDVRLTAAPQPRPAAIDTDIAALERVLVELRDSLDPVTVEVLERSLETIDMAIEDALAALAADPGNALLARQLENTKQKKLDVLRRAQRVQRAST